MIEVRVPDEQEGTKAVVRAWLKRIGDAVAENDPLVELETDKVTQEVPAPAAGVLAEIVLDTDAEAVPGALLARIETESSRAKVGAKEAKPSEPIEQKAAAAAPGPRPAPGIREERLSPSVRRACLQHGIDASRIEGTGRNGRVTREDVDRAVASATVVNVGEPATAQPRQFSPHDIPHDR
ncbi:MAG: E3 binding domain-containing protein, partial [Sphingomonas sp.]|nr:E3 binding domain-containing protein [Sphingomonas sp.]